MKIKMRTAQEMGINKIATKANLNTQNDACFIFIN